MESSSKKRHIRTRRWIGIIITFFALSFLVFRASQGFQGLDLQSISISLEFILLSIGFQLAGVCIAAAVWGEILKQFGVHSNYFYDLRVFGISALGRKIPGMIWYIVGRMFLYAKIGIPNTIVIFATIMEFTTLSLAGIFALLLAIILGNFEIALPETILKFQSVLIGMLIILLLISPSAIRFLYRVFASKIQSKQFIMMNDWNYWQILGWVVAQTIVLSLGAGVLYSVGRAIGEFQNISYILIFGAWGLVVALGPLAVWIPGEFGVKAGIVYVILSPLIGEPPAAIVTLLWRVWVSAMEISIGVLSGFSLGVNRLQPWISKND
jgi:hypothetical protein